MNEYEYKGVIALLNLLTIWLCLKLFKPFYNKHIVFQKGFKAGLEKGLSLGKAAYTELMMMPSENAYQSYISIKANVPPVDL